MITLKLPPEQVERIQRAISVYREKVVETQNGFKKIAAPGSPVHMFNHELANIHGLQLAIESQVRFDQKG